MDPGTDDAAAFARRFERTDDQRADGRENDRRVEGCGRRGFRIAGPRCAELEGERLARGIAAPGKRVDLAPLVTCHLRDDVGRGAETVNTEAARIARHDERAVADETRAQQRRSVGVVVFGRNREAILRTRGEVFGVAAVEIAAGETRPVAQVLLAPRAVRARAARGAEPRHADAVAGTVPPPTAEPWATTSPTTS